MKLSECRMGVLVTMKPHLSEAKGKFDIEIGHVVGLTKTVATVSEVTPLVQWAGEEKPRGVHHANLDLFTAW